MARTMPLCPFRPASARTLTGRTTSAPHALAATCPTVPAPIAIGSTDRSGQGTLVGADDLEVLVDEDVVRPVDTDVVDLVLAVAQLHNTVDDAARVGG